MYKRKRAASVSQANAISKKYRAVRATPSYVRSRGSVNELKDITLTTSAFTPPLSAAAQFFLLNPCIQGSTPSTRNGRRIAMKSLLFKMVIGLAPTTTGSSPIRVLIVYDRQTNATAASATDVLLTNEITSPMQLNNSRRFSILMDKVVPCIGTGGPQCAVIDKYIPLNLNTEFNTSNAGTVADITTGSIYAFVWQANTLGVAAPVAQLYSRIRFSDN